MDIKQLEEGDAAILKLTEEDIKRITSILDHDLMYAQFTQKAARSYNRSIAEEILFWDDILNNNERCETASLRGKLLAIKKDADNGYWIVEKECSDEDDDDDEEWEDEDDDD